MASKRETILLALKAALETIEGVTVLRNEPFPNEVPPGGLLILRDGDPGEPEVTLSPTIYSWQHRTVLEVAIQDDNADERDAILDALLGNITTLINGDKTLGGLCDGVQPSPGDPDTLPVIGGPSIKAVIISIDLFYDTTDPLG